MRPKQRMMNGFEHLSRVFEADQSPRSLARFELLFWITTLAILYLEDHLRFGLGDNSEFSLWCFLGTSLAIIFSIGADLSQRARPYTLALHTFRFGAALSFTVYATTKTESIGLRHDESALALALWILAIMGPWSRRSVQFLIAFIFLFAGVHKLQSQSSWWLSGQAINDYLRWSNFLYLGQYSDWQRSVNRWLLKSDLQAVLGPSLVFGEIFLGTAALFRRSWAAAIIGIALLLILFRCALYVPFTLVVPLLVFTCPWPQRSSCSAEMTPAKPECYKE